MKVAQVNGQTDIKKRLNKWMNERTNERTNKQMNERTNRWTDSCRKTTRQKKLTKERRKKRRRHKCRLFIIGGRNVVFYFRWHKCRLIPSGKKVDFTIGGTNSAVAETSWWHKRQWH
jgi:hypothetical protein